MIFTPQMILIRSSLILPRINIINTKSFLTAYDQNAGGSNKADCLIRFLLNFHPTLMKRLILSIKGRYEKAG